MNFDDYRSLLPARKRDAHKGDFGHLLIIGGDHGLSGSVRLAALAAARIGTGLVTVATRPDHAPLINLQQPEIMTFALINANDLQVLLERVTTIVIGPGLGQTVWAHKLLNSVLECEKPLLLDADALNLLSQEPKRQDNWILTPHPGEAARLLNCDNSTIQQDRNKAALSLQHRYGGVIVLKGAGTLVVDGTDKIDCCDEGNPGMASGGMGDLLSGIIGGLLAQGFNLSDAASCGVALHARAGDLAAEQGGERGLLASDLLPYLRQVVNGR